MKELLAGDFKDGEKVVDAFYRHPLIKSLSQGEGGRSSYIPPEIVGKVVESVVIAKAGVGTLEQAVDDLPDNSHIKDLLQHFVEESKLGAVGFQQSVAAHFDTMMERASGWFKRRTRWVTLGVSLVVVAAVNVDTIAITTALASDPNAQAALVSLSQERVQRELTTQQKAANQEGDAPAPWRSASSHWRAARSSPAELKG